jgi:hypothetical protein
MSRSLDKLGAPITRAMKDNPLTTTVIVFLIGDAYTLYEAVTSGRVNPYTALAWLQLVILIVLYVAKSRFAGAYLFYSILPFFPVYFGLKALGLNPPPPRPTTYVVAFAIYVFALFALWKQKKAYDQYYSTVVAGQIANG